MSVRRYSNFITSKLTLEATPMRKGTFTPQHEVEHVPLFPFQRSGTGLASISRDQSAPGTRPNSTTGSLASNVTRPETTMSRRSYEEPDFMPGTRPSSHVELKPSTRPSSIVEPDHDTRSNSPKAPSFKLNTQGTFSQGLSATIEEVPEGIITQLILISTPWLIYSALRPCRWQRRLRAGALACGEISGRFLGSSSQE